MIPGVLDAAIEINEAWRSCLNGMASPDCPTDPQVAEIITKHIEGAAE